MKFSRQFDQMDCGPACVRMVASYYGKDYPLSYLRSLAHLTREGVSVAGIRDSLTAIGMNSATFEMSLEQLYTDCPLPAILYWDQNTKFCGVCGAPMKLHTDISKRCTNCGKEVWPALATAIIVAITRNNGEEILLVQSNKFKKDYMGLVAGFVETGETLEECLQREVWEETHIHVKNIRYFASQPWPYPSGLMVGFTAEYDGGEIHLQHSELNKGGWFNRENMPAIPGKVSLARQLIDHWFEKKD